MSEPFIGQIRIVAFNFAPRNNAFCNGQILPINQNQALFSILGTTYGGNGVTTFALPDLRGRAPSHSGAGPVPLGTAGGEVNHTLQINEIPQHSHTAQGAPTGTVETPVGNTWAGLASGTVLPFSSAAPNATLEAAAIGPGGGNQPHPNLQPYLVINFIIALIGVFPSRN